MFAELKTHSKVGHIAKKLTDNELRPPCTLCKNFSSIVLVFRDEKQLKILMEKWNKEKGEGERIQHP